jgi:hypothetical protein
MDLPIYKLQIDASVESDLQVDYVALVDKPAIEKDFIAFNQNKPLQFAVINEDRHIISGAAMLADVPIYRRDEQMGEYFVVFDASTIFQIVEKFFSKGFNQNFNLMHDPEAKLPGVCVFESFIVDKSRGIQPMVGFEDAKDGSWFMSAKVNNEEVWQKIKSGTVKGFLVEGVFSYKKTPMSAEQTLAKIMDLLNDTKQD